MNIKQERTLPSVNKVRRNSWYINKLMPG